MAGVDYDIKKRGVQVEQSGARSRKSTECITVFLVSSPCLRTEDGRAVGRGGRGEKGRGGGEKEGEGEVRGLTVGAARGRHPANGPP